LGITKNPGAFLSSLCNPTPHPGHTLATSIRASASSLASSLAVATTPPRAVVDRPARALAPSRRAPTLDVVDARARARADAVDRVVTNAFPLARVTNALANARMTCRILPFPRVRGGARERQQTLETMRHASTARAPSSRARRHGG
tara:strand:+ start:8624 stop:9061 length:438 start_codon:yes stop_codon:yes gene_type:complete